MPNSFRNSLAMVLIKIVHPDKDNTLILFTLPKVFQNRRFGAAGHTPARPEVDHNPFAARNSESRITSPSKVVAKIWRDASGAACAAILVAQPHSEKCNKHQQHPEDRNAPQRGALRHLFACRINLCRCSRNLCVPPSAGLGSGLLPHSRDNSSSNFSS